MMQFNKLQNTGKVKGLLVGINYRGTNLQLGGCINDVLAIQKLIKNTYFDAELEVLTDDTFEKPTRDNILNKLTRLVSDAKAGDLIIFQYSGHGSQVQDIHGDEEDGLDETICPIDYMKPRKIVYKGSTFVVDSQITDDEINKIISNIPKGAKLLMLSDSCHSGTVADLKNDLAHYQGGNVWVDAENNSMMSASFCSSVNNDCVNNYSYSNVSTNYVLSTVTTISTWMYVESYNKKEIWITSHGSSVNEELNNKKWIIPLDNNNIRSLGSLSYQPNKIRKVFGVFKKMSDGSYQISSAELGINNLVLPPNNKRVESTKTMASWIYVRLSSKEEIWITPKDPTLFAQLGNKRFIIPVTDRNRGTFVKLLDWSNISKDVMTVFNQLSNGSYQISSEELNIEDLIFDFNRNKEIEENHVDYWYDKKKNKHHHVHKLTGEKRSLNMRSPNCHGGELRLISGSRENQTSADTGKNGAFTMAFLSTADILGGLKNFIDKIFSHNLQDLKLVENTINQHLAKFGFHQYSVISWDHASSSKDLTKNVNVEAKLRSSHSLPDNLNKAVAFSPNDDHKNVFQGVDLIEPTILYRSAISKEQVKDYVNNALSALSMVRTPRSLSLPETEENVTESFRNDRSFSEGEYFSVNKPKFIM